MCHKHVPLALECWSSLVRCSSNEVRLQVHDDGTLTAEDVAKITERFPTCRIVSRAEADERMAQELRKFPASAAYRERSPLGLKALDTFYFHPAPVYIYSDSDVLYLRRFENLFRLPDEKKHALIMSDVVNSYSLRSWQLLQSPRVCLPRMANSGLMCLRREKYDPELIEWFFSKPQHAGNFYFFEQTMWAFLLQNVGCRKWDSRQVALVTSQTKTEDLVAAHITTRRDAVIEKLVQQSQHAISQPIVEVETVSSGRCTPWDLFCTESRRVWKRAKNRARRSNTNQNLR